MSEVSSQIKPIINAIIFGDALYRIPNKNIDTVLAESNARAINLDWGSPSSFALATLDAFSENNRTFDLMKSMSKIEDGKFTPENKSTLTDSPIEKQAIDKYRKNLLTPSKTAAKNTLNSNSFLTRMIIVSANATKLYGADFISNSKAMDEIHKAVALTHNNPSAMVAGGFISVLVSQLITNADSNMTIDNSLSLIYEYYSSRKTFQSELNKLSALNLPGFKDTKKENLITDMNCFHTIENAIWAVDRAKNIQEALKNGLKLKEKNSVTMSITTVYAMCHFNKQEYINRKANYFKNSDEIEVIARVAEKSRKFI